VATAAAGPAATWDGVGVGEGVGVCSIVEGGSTPGTMERVFSAWSLDRDEPFDALLAGSRPEYGSEWS
jgi:hypothetical protein